MQVVDVNGNMFGYDHLEIIGADGRPKNIDNGLTSVGLSMPSAFTVSNSPLTSNGTIGVTGAGTTSQYIDGTGALRTFPGLTGYVPYVGATQNVNLGEFGITAGQFTLDVSPTGTAVVGTTRWNNTIGSSETTLKGGNVILKNGVDLVARVVNKVTPNTTLTKAGYAAVRVSGAQGQRLAVAYAQANNDNNSADTIGLVTETIATNQEGFIITVGQIEEINTTGSLQGETWADGDVLYLSPTTPGALTNVKPNGATGHIVVMGYVEYAHANHGKIYVKIMNGWELDELHNVYINNPLNNQGLFYNASDQLWKNKSIDSALGYTPVPDSRRLTINGTTYDLTADRTWSVGTVTSVTASSPLSSSGGTTPNITISQATGSTNGYLSSADWTTFNSKQPAGSYITALSGEATGTGPGTAAVTLNNASVTAKVLTGVNITGGSISASDSILTAFGKLQNQINGLIGSSVYQGTWNASTNTPALASGVGTRGYYYIVNVAGSTNLDGITDWNVGDWAIFDGTAWQQVDNTDSVTSVNGQTGAVSLTTDNIPEGATNLYFTQLRARQSITLTTSGSSGASTYNNSTGALNIPNYTLSGLGGVPSSRRIEINGISYDLSADRSWSVGTVTSIATSGPLTGGTITGSGTIGINQASATDDGYLSSTDWNTFNNKQNAITLTTTGTSGPATLIGSTLNIPQYQSVITNPVTGTGVANYVARWTSSSNIGTGVLYDNGTNVGIGTSSPSERLSVNGNIALSKTGETFIYNDQSGSDSVSIGGASYISFKTFGSGWEEKVRIVNNGNVGIGTTNPTAKLHVWNGKIEITGFPSAGSPFTFLESNYNDQSAVTIRFLNYNPSNGYDSDLGVQLMNTSGSMFDAMIIKGSTGNLGIGTNTPAQKLEVNGNIKLSSTVGQTSTPSYIWLGNDFSNGATRDKLKIYLYNSGTEQYGFSVGSNADVQYHSNGIHDFYIANSNAVRINSNGHVGIGTTAPSQKLHVVGNIYANGGFIGYRTDGGIGLEVNGGDMGPGTFIAKFNDYNNTSRVVINGVGDVGIGTTTPTKYMSSTETLMSIVNSNVASLYLYSTTGHLYNMSSISNGDLFWYDVSAGTERMRLTGSGNFGIGTSSPAYKLDVNGNARAAGMTLNAFATGTSGGNLELGFDGSQGVVQAYNRSSGWIPLYLSGDDIRFNPQGAERMRITSAGNVGIGTTNPTELLNLSKSSTNNYIKVEAGGQAANYSGLMLTEYGINWGWSLRHNAGTDLLHISYQDNTPTFVDSLTFARTGSVKFNAYGSGSFTGTRAYDLAVDSSGNIIEVPVGAGTVTGSGTANYVARWTSSSNISTGVLYDNGTNIGVGTTNPKTKFDVNGDIGFGSKGMSISDVFADALTVNMNDHSGCYVKITAFGDWGNHSTIAYVAEFFLQASGGGYNEPGLIIKQVDNTANDDIQAQILDPVGTGTRNFVIQLKSTSSSYTPFNAYIQYEVRGLYNSVS
jgi:hypothetical protein